MTIDFVVLILLGVAVWLGWRRGAVSQVGRIAAAVLAVMGASWVAGPLQEIFFAQSAWSQPAIEATSLLLAAGLIYVSIAFSGWLLVKAMRAVSENLGRLDRLGGAGLGLLKGLLLIYFVLTLLVLLESPLQRFDPGNSLKLRGGQATTLVETYNVLAPWQLPDLARLHGALKVRYYTEHLGRPYVLREHAWANDFLRRELISLMSRDSALMQAVVADRFALTLADPRVRELLNDEEATQVLRSIDWDALLKEVQSPLHG